MRQWRSRPQLHSAPLAAARCDAACSRSTFRGSVHLRSQGTCRVPTASAPRARGVDGGGTLITMARRSSARSPPGRLRGLSGHLHAPQGGMTRARRCTSFRGDNVGDGCHDVAQLALKVSSIAKDLVRRMVCPYGLGFLIYGHSLERLLPAGFTHHVILCCSVCGGDEVHDSCVSPPIDLRLCDTVSCQDVCPFIFLHVRLAVHKAAVAEQHRITADLLRDHRQSIF
mmetsp:Transcript_22997/g.67755  ORF Transcript_22997/g.67755 Transcript_22997/m.67755 type:complete len:227 (-) Transcript_22997:256-936(-)